MIIAIQRALERTEGYRGGQRALEGAEGRRGDKGL
jgi:hypothetical protein